MQLRIDRYWLLLHEQLDLNSGLPFQPYFSNLRLFSRIPSFFSQHVYFLVQTNGNFACISRYL